MSKKLQKATSQQINKMAGIYDGSELRAYSDRPGAMDAFDKPSLVGNTRMKHKPMIGMTSQAKTPFYTN